MAVLSSPLMVLLLVGASCCYVLSMPAEGGIVCRSVHDVFKVGQVFSDEHCRRVKCISYQGEGYVDEVEGCVEPEKPEGLQCDDVSDKSKPFPECCSRYRCSISFQ